MTKKVQSKAFGCFRVRPRSLCQTPDEICQTAWALTGQFQAGVEISQASTDICRRTRLTLPGKHGKCASKARSMNLCAWEFSLVQILQSAEAGFAWICYKTALRQACFTRGLSSWPCSARAQLWNIVKPSLRQAECAAPQTTSLRSMMPGVESRIR